MPWLAESFATSKMTSKCNDSLCQQLQVLINATTLYANRHLAPRVGVEFPKSGSSCRETPLAAVLRRLYTTWKMPTKSNLPRPVEATDALDPYEAKYMHGRGAVVLQAKTLTNWQAPAFAGVMSAFVVVWCATHAALGAGLGLGLGACLMLLGLFFAVLRVKVTSEYVDIHYGLIGPKIPVGAIESVEAVVHAHRSLLRWGVSPLGRGEWLYSIAGDEGRAVKIVWRSPEGRRRVHYVGSREHEQLAASIELAREMRAHNGVPAGLLPASEPE